MTRILALTLYYPPHHDGGYELSCRDVMTRLAQRGHDVRVLTSNHRIAGVSTPDDPAVPVDRSLVGWVRDNAVYRPSPLRRWQIERANHAALAATLRRHRPDVVTVWHMGAMSLGLLQDLVDAALPVVYVIGDDWLCYAPELDSWSRMFRHLRPVAGLLRRILGVPVTPPDISQTGPFLFNSEDNRRRAEAGSRWRFPRHAVVYSGFDTRMFNPGDRVPSETRPWRGRILFAGRYDPRKGLATVIDAMTHLPGHTLEIRGTGDGPERERLQALARCRSVDGHVDFATPLAPAELAQRYREADVVVFPSEWDEPFGLVPVEAMACGTPVIGTARGGSAEFMLDGVNCLRFPAGDPVALAGAVRRLAADAELRGRLTAAGRRTASFFDVEYLTDAVEAWVTASIGGAVHRAGTRSFTSDVAIGPSTAMPAHGSGRLGDR